MNSYQRLKEKQVKIKLKYFGITQINVYLREYFKIFGSFDVRPNDNKINVMNGKMDDI